MLLSSVGPMAPGDLIAKDSLVSGCVSVEWAGPRSSRFLQGWGSMARGLIGSSCEQNVLCSGGMFG